MSKDGMLRALEVWMNSEESLEMFGEDDQAAEDYFWDNEELFADSY